MSGKLDRTESPSEVSDSHVPAWLELSLIVIAGSAGFTLLGARDRPVVLLGLSRVQETVGTRLVPNDGGTTNSAGEPIRPEEDSPCP